MKLSEEQKILTKTRRKIISDLKKIFSSKMWDSGFRVGPIGNSRPMKLWSPRDINKRLTVVEFDGYSLTEFWGFSENGIIIDASGGGCVTQSLSSFPVEDLVMLYNWAIKNVG